MPSRAGEPCAAAGSEDEGEDEAGGGNSECSHAACSAKVTSNAAGTRVAALLGCILSGITGEVLYPTQQLHGQLAFMRSSEQGPLTVLCATRQLACALNLYIDGGSAGLGHDQDLLSHDTSDRLGVHVVLLHRASPAGHKRQLHQGSREVQQAGALPLSCWFGPPQSVSVLSAELSKMMPSSCLHDSYQGQQMLLSMAIPCRSIPLAYHEGFQGLYHDVPLSC